jgi:putative membrane protein
MKFTTATMRIRANFRENRLLQVLLVVYLVFWSIMAIKPLHPDDWLLENLLVFVCVPALAITYKRFTLSDLSYLLITIFMMLHAVGSHYTYAEVPFGFWMQEVFDLSRNHFDRVVHFTFGLLLAYPIREIFLRVAHTRGFWAYYLPLDVTLAFSGLYEIIEWFATIFTNPELGAAYLGTQGDEWDAQKDMGLAALGALICMTLTAVIKRARGHRISSDQAKSG